MHPPRGSPHTQLWAIDPRVTLLNHGSFGATPRLVLAEADRFRLLVEQEPVGFFVEQLEPLLDQARATMAAFVGCDPDDFAFISNASAGVSTVARSLQLEPGDELLTTAHEYNACNNALRHAAQRAGAKVVTVRFPFPATSPAQIASAVLAGITPRTKLLLLSHITSPSATITPAAEIIRQAQNRGVDVLLDSAHSPGCVPLNLRELAPAYATGNFHKWLCAPKGSAFLFVRRDRQASMQPLTISHGMNSPRTDRSRFRLEFDFAGTLDPAPWLATPAALRLLPTLVPDATWAGVMQANHALAQHGAAIVADALGSRPPLPPALCASMSLVPIPAHEPELDARLRARPTRYADALQDRLLTNYAIQVPVLRMPPQPGETLETDRYLRLSAQLYNTPEQYAFLAHALTRELALERAAG